MNAVLAEPARTCPKCGGLIALGASFCRQCGTQLEEPGVPSPSPPDPGRPTCPNCKREIRTGSAFCRFCGAATEATVTPEKPAPPPSAQPAVPQPPAAAPPTIRRSGRRTAILAVIAGLLAIGGGVAATMVLLGGGGGSEKTAIARPGSRGTAPVVTAAAPEHVERASTPAEDKGFPAETKAQMAEEITSLLRGYHEDVVEEDFQGAWALLSSRKRKQNLAEYGYHKWGVAQASLTPYLQPYDLQANVVALEDEGVARVDVTGMEWTKPGASMLGMVGTDLGQVRTQPVDL